MPRILIYFLLFFPFFLSGQQLPDKPTTIRLKKLLKDGKRDSFLIALNELTRNTRQVLSNEEISLSDSLQEIYVGNLSVLYTFLGKYYGQLGKPDSAYYYLIQIPEILSWYEKTTPRLQKVLAGTYMNTGTALILQENIQEGLQYYDKSAKLFLRIGDTLQYSRLLLNIGSIYDDNKEVGEAIKYLKMASEYAPKNNRRGLDITLSAYKRLVQIGLEHKNDSLISEYLPKTDSLLKQMREKKYPVPPSVFLTKARISIYRKNFREVEKYLQEALREIEKQKIYNTLFEVNLLRGQLAFEQKKYRLAEKYFLEALEDLDKHSNKATRDKLILYELLYKAAKKQRNYKKMSEYLEKAYELKNRLDRTSQVRKLTQVATRIEMEKQILAEQLKREKEQAIALEKLKRQQILIWTAVGILALFIFFLGILYNRYKIIRKQKQALQEASQEIEAQNALLAKQNQELEQKNKLIAKKNKDILDSIIAAKRIQTAFIPPEELLQRVFYDAFVIYLPRDHVSGDFYWVGIEEKYKYIAVADCTGHGIPAAMLSMLGQMALSTALKELEDPSPAAILEFMQHYVIDALLRYGKDLNEGLELTICRFNKEENILEIASAKRFALVYSNLSKKIRKLKGSSYSIGPGELWKKEKGMNIYVFQEEIIPLKKDELLTVYMTSDGYIDQFGGARNKKLGTKRFMKLIESIVEKPLEEQKEILLKFLEKWQGNNPQLDDITLVAVQLTPELV